MEQLLERLEIMRNANILSQNNMEKVISMIHLLKNDYNIQMTEENSGILVTHVAMYLGRKDTSNVDSLDEDSLKEIRESKYYDLSENMLKKIEKNILGNIKKNERNFILLHIINMLDIINK